MPDLATRKAEAHKNFDKYIRDWRRLSISVVSELWVFYQKLAKPGKRTDLPSFDGRLPTWYEWLESKGIGAIPGRNRTILIRFDGLSEGDV